MSAYLGNRLYDLTDATDLADFGTKTVGDKDAAAILAAGYTYVAGANADSATKVSSATSADGISKATFFTGKNLRPNDKASSGNMYFAVESSAITSDDDDVYVVIEYLDYDANMSTTQNSNGTYNYKNQTSIDPTFATNPAGGSVDCTGYPSFRRHNTNTWRTIAIPVSNAELTSTNTKTGLVNNKQDIKICVNSVNTHISRVGVVKASDVGAAEHVYYAPETEGDAPTIWLAGDSIVEQLDYVNAYPREGWGMELANYFIQDSISNAATYTYDADDYRVTTEVNEGVKVINRTKGGKSTRTFLNQVDPSAGATATDTRWSDILNGAKRGDYLFVSFCINDVSNRTTVQTNPFLVGDPGDRFSHRANIAEFKAECDKIGVNLVLLTPAAGRTLSNNQDAHILSVHAQGRELGIPVIDVRTYHKALVQALNDANDTDVYPVDKTKLIYNHILDSDINAEYNSGLGSADNTHINQTGAKEICKIIVQEIMRKSASFDSMEALSAWINPNADIETMAAPAHQTTEIKYEVSDVKYLVDGEEKSSYQQGEVQVQLTVANTGAAANDAIVYVALYDSDNKLVDVVVSDKAELASGASATITTPAISVPDLDGYKLRKFVWNSNMVPYDTSSAAVVLTADGFNRKAILEWQLSKDLGDDVTFDIYRDNLKIATTQNAGYVDEGVQRGEHLYQINAVDANGDVVGQSAYASVTVTNLYEVKQNPDVFYTKAHINSMGNEANLNNGINIVAGGAVYYPQEAVAALGLTDADIEASYGTNGTHKFQGAPLITNGGENSYKVVRVKDKYGIEKDAYMFASMYRPNKKAATTGKFTIDESATSNFTTEDTQVTVFIEFLGNRTAPTLQYWGSTTTTNDNGTADDTSDDTTETTYGSKTASAVAYSGKTTGDWRIARYDIKDAYFAEDTTYSSDAMMRIDSGYGTPAYISSVVVVKGDAAKAHKVMNELNNLEFREAYVQNASAKYPNGISADFSSGTAVLDGIDVVYTTSGTSDNRGEVALADDGVGYYGTEQVILDSGALKGTYLYFKLDPEYIYGGSNKLYVDITYKADYDMNLSVSTPRYDKDTGVAVTGSSSTNVPLVKNLEQNWQNASFVIDNPGSLRLDNNGAYMRMSISQSLDDPEKQIRISKITIRNADFAPVQVIQDAAASTGHTLHIAADSIAAYYSADKVAEKGITGWGMTIGDYLTDDITINNKATAGASTVTFANMPSILTNVKEGDYVLISFAHNDQMSSKWVEIDDYKANLTNWINQIRDKKGVPVLVTCIPQGKYSTGTLVQSSSLADRREAVAQVAEAEDVMLVKLGEKMFEDEANGVITTVDVKAMYCDEGYDNRTHVTEAGARYISQIIVNSMKEQSAHFAKHVK